MLKPLITRDLREIAHAPTNYEVLLRQLNGCLDVLRGDDPLVEARVRGLKMKEELLKKAGGALDADEVAPLLHLTRQAVYKRRKARKLLAIQFGKRGFLYPAFQFEGALADSVVRVLGQLDPCIRDWNLLTFFLNGNSYLDGASPIEALRQAAVDEVLRAAQAYGSQGAG